MTIKRIAIDGGGDEWWEFEGEGWRLAGRSKGSAMSGWTLEEIEEHWPPVRIQADRGRDTSSELVEVRTVLGRAENALATLVKHRDRQFLKGYMRHGPDDPPRGTWVEDRTPDPDVDDMITELEGVIARLSRWRRTGRPTKGARP